MADNELLWILGALAVLAWMYFVFRPFDPASKRNNVQVGYVKGNNVSEASIFWYYATIFVICIIVGVINLLTK